MEKEKLKDNLHYFVQFLANPVLSKEGMQKRWNKLLELVNATHDEVIGAIVKAFEKKGETLGLSGKELISLADKLNIKHLNKLIYTKLSPNEQEERSDLNEDEIQDKGLTVLDKAFIQYVLAQSQGDADQIANCLQDAAAKGDSDYLMQLQQKLDAKDLLHLSQKISALQDSELKEAGASVPFTSTVNVAPYMVPLGSEAPSKKKRKKE